MSTRILLLVNIFPIIGIIFFDWNIFSIFFLYWAESAAIGIFNIFKMFKIGGPLSVPLVIFFIFHYSVFMMAHLMFIMVLFNPGGMLMVMNQSDLIIYFKDIYIVLAFIFISHGFSFVVNFYQKKEYSKTTLGKQMGAPYARIIIMQLAIIFGGFLLMLLHSQILVAILLVALKIFFDLKAHNKEHLIKT